MASIAPPVVERLRTPGGNMATVTFANQTYSGPSSVLATITSSPTLISLNFTATGVVDNYFGNFVLSETSVIGGTLTQFSETYRGSCPSTVTGLQVPAAPMAAAVQFVDTMTMLNLLFGGSDTILGSAYGEPIYAGPGNDTVIALGGDDLIVGWDGNDDINGNQGQDVVLGGAGADTVRAARAPTPSAATTATTRTSTAISATTRCPARTATTPSMAARAPTPVFGDAGNDLISGDLGNDILFGGTGADWFVMRLARGIGRGRRFQRGAGRSHRPGSGRDLHLLRPRRMRCLSP